MLPEGIDYKRFMHELRQQRIALKQQIDAIDSVITGMEQMARIGVSMPGGRGKESEPEIQKNTFSAYKPSKAALHYLGMVNRRATTAEIVQALQNGGVKSSSENLYSIVYTALSRLADKGKVRKVDGPSGVEWQLIGEASE
jgi:hypothetical protein